jgi:hypothetical protein
MYCLSITRGLWASYSVSMTMEHIHSQDGLVGAGLGPGYGHKCAKCQNGQHAQSIGKAGVGELELDYRYLTVGSLGVHQVDGE